MHAVLHAMTDSCSSTAHQQSSSDRKQSQILNRDSSTTARPNCVGRADRAHGANLLMSHFDLVWLPGSPTSESDSRPLSWLSRGLHRRWVRTMRCFGCMPSHDQACTRRGGDARARHNGSRFTLGHGQSNHKMTVWECGVEVTSPFRKPKYWSRE